VTLNCEHKRRGDVIIELTSPNGIVSVLSPGRKYDDSTKGFKDWRFMSVVHWEENPVGIWTLRVKDTHRNRKTGYLIDWTLKLWGEKMVIPERPPPEEEKVIPPSQPAPQPLPKPEEKKLENHPKPESPLSKPIPPPSVPIDHHAGTTTLAHTTTTLTTQPTTAITNGTLTATIEDAVGTAIPDAKISHLPSSFTTFAESISTPIFLIILLISGIFTVYVVYRWLLKRRDPRSQYEFVPLRAAGGEHGNAATSKELMAAFGDDAIEDSEDEQLLFDAVIDGGNVVRNHEEEGHDESTSDSWELANRE